MYVLPHPVGWPCGIKASAVTAVSTVTCRAALPRIVSPRCRDALPMQDLRIALFFNTLQTSNVRRT